MSVGHREIDTDDMLFIDAIRGASILRVMLMHLGLGWFYLPYSTMFTLFFPVLFFASGAVTFNSFLRGHSGTVFLIRRLSLILIPYVIFMAFMVLTFLLSNAFREQEIAINWYSIFVIRPIVKDFGVHLGHIWFLQALFVMTVIAIPVFILLKKSNKGNILLFLLSFSLILFNEFSNYELEKELKFFGFNLYLGAANLFFFSLGILYFTNKAKFTMPRLLIMVTVVSITFIGLLTQVEDFSFNVYRNQVALVYIVGATTVILLLLLMQFRILYFLNHTKGRAVKKGLLFMSHHAFALFLIHIPILAVTDYFLATYADTGRFVSGLLRLPTVLFLSLLIAPYFTTLTKQFTTRISEQLKRFDAQLGK